MAAKKLNYNQKCSQVLDNTLSCIPRFLDFLNSEKRNMSHLNGLDLYEPKMDILFGLSLSGNLQQDNLYRVLKVINSLQLEGRHGTAYFIKLYHLSRFPHQFQQEDRFMLDNIAGDFVHLLRQNSDADWLQHVPQPFWDSFLRSPLLPHEIVLLRHSVEGKNPRNMALSLPIYKPDEDRRDCLGRSISHILKDHGSKETWRIKADLHHQDILGRTALYYACREEDASFVVELLSAGADMYKPVVTGMSPLHFAARHGDTKTCEHLWTFHSSQRPPQDVQSFQDTPFMCAIIARSPDTVEFFCKNVLTPNDRLRLSSMLIIAVKRKDLQVVNVLLRYMKYDSIRERDDEGHDALWYAQKIRGDQSKIEFALLKAIGINSRIWGHIHDPPELNIFHKVLYPYIDKKTEPKTLWTLSMQIDQAFLNQLLELDGFLKTLQHEDLIRVRGIAEGMKNKHFLLNIDKTIVQRLQNDPQFAERIPLKLLTMVKRNPQVICDDNARRVIDRAIEHARSLLLFQIPGHPGKRHRPNGDNNSFTESTS